MKFSLIALSTLLLSADALLSNPLSQKAGVSKG